MKINIKSFFITLCAVFIIRPYYVQLQSLLNLMWAYTTLVLALICFAKARKYGNFKKDKFFYIFILLYLIATGYSSKENIMSAISNVAQITLAYNLGRLYKNVNYRKYIIKNVSIIISTFVYIDFLTIILGISSRYLQLDSTISFLGYDNYAAFYIIPLIGVKLLLDYLKKNKLSKEDMFFYLICVLGKIITQSYAALIALILIPVWIYILNYNKKLRNIFNVRNIIYVVIFLFIGIYFFNIQYLFSDLLGFLGKGVTLNSRTVIWKHVLSNIEKIPLWGLGCIDAEFFMEFFGFPYGYNATHAHFLLLDLIIQTGVLGVLVYLRMLFNIKFKTIYMRNYGYNYAVACVLSFVLLSFFDSYPFVSTIYLLISLIIRVNSEIKMGTK